MENTGSCNHIQASISACVREGYLELPEEGTSEITKNVFTKYFLNNIEDEETEKWSDLLQNVALIQCLARAYDFENPMADRDPELAIAMYESIVGKSAEATNNLALLYLKGEKLKKTLIKHASF